MVQVLLTKSAQLDLAEAVDWYNANAPHVVDRFRRSMQVAMRRIADNPSTSRWFCVTSAR